jgi:type II secretory pathway pseudopilin PulG
MMAKVRAVSPLRGVNGAAILKSDIEGADTAIEMRRPGSLTHAPGRLTPRGELSREDGFTLVEMMMSFLLMGVIATAFLSVLVSTQGAVAREDMRSQTLNQARQAFDQLDREIRSGNLIYDPSLENSTSCGGYTCAPYFALRIYTQANGNTRTPANQCVQYIITTNNQLLRRAWAPGAATSLSGWRVVADGIVNRTSSPSYSAFWGATTGSRTVNVQLQVNATPGDPRSKRVDLLYQSFSIRNYATGDPCSPIPAT